MIWLKKNLNLTAALNMSKSYLVFPRVEAQNFNANAGAYISGVPQPTAICGLVHAFCLAWERSRPGELANLFPLTLYAVSQFSGPQGQSRNPKATFGAKISDGPSAAMSDRPRANLEFSLVLELDLQNVSPASDASLVPKLMHVFERLRLNGASLWLQGNPRFFDTKEAALNSLPANTFVLSDESDTLQYWLESEPDLQVSQALADLCARPSAYGEYKPKYVPVISGLTEITEQSNMPGARNSYKHAYAEPVIGLARFRSVQSVRRAYKSEDESARVDVVLPDGSSALVSPVPKTFWTYIAPPEGLPMHLVGATH